ncbi:MAG TPA: PAS domain S-box protein [Candidatus Baltobacteraceae bacterium]|nr:PAS domain S-box protein [Candidatus Baltobacteraceae bacterium]
MNSRDARLGQAMERGEQEHLQVLLEAAPIAIVLIDDEDRIALVNRQTERLFGSPRAELLRRPFDAIVRSEDERPWRDVARGTESAVPHEFVAIREGGATVPVDVGFNAIATAEGEYVLAAITDVSERKGAEEHLRMMLEAAPNALVVSDAGGRITRVNAELEELLGYSRSELLGTPIERLVPQRFRGAHPVLRERYVAAPTARPMGAGRDLFAVHKDGSEIPVEIGLAPITTPRGDFVLASVIDIRERKQMEELRLLSVGEHRRRVDAEADRDRARDASQLKSQFVATMSHELRTPLNAIIGMTELLTATALDERQRGYVRRINESAEALLGIISGILEFSKIEAGKIELADEEFSMESVVAGAADVLAGQARTKGIGLHVYVDPLIPAVLCGDADRLRQVLLNLVANAVKFTDQGRVVVRALPAEIGARSAMVRFEVQDSGIGIGGDVLPKLFQPFVQADSSSSRSYGGTGLGLSIAKRVVEAMHGDIGVTSEIGSGSLFWFDAKFTRPRVVETTPRIVGAGALVASEDDAFAEIVERYVAAWGMVSRRVCALDDAADIVLDAPSEDTPDWVAIVDVDSPHGQAIAAALRELPRLGPARVVTIGPEEALAEPLRPSDLFNAVIDALASANARRKAGSSVPVAVTSAAAGTTVLVAEDNANMHEVLVHQFDALGVKVRIVSDGAQAVGAVRREHYDVVFMDVQMPNVDGFEATRRIRDDERKTGKHVPIVAMTANAFKEDRDACLAAGMDDYLAKPVRLESLRATLARWSPALR